MVTVGKAEIPLQQKCLAAHVWKRQKKMLRRGHSFLPQLHLDPTATNVMQGVVVPHLDLVFLVQDFLIFIATWPSTELSTMWALEAEHGRLTHFLATAISLEI